MWWEIGVRALIILKQSWSEALMDSQGHTLSQDSQGHTLSWTACELNSEMRDVNWKMCVPVNTWYLIPITAMQL